MSIIHIILFGWLTIIKSAANALSNDCNVKSIDGECHAPTTTNDQSNTNNIDYLIVGAGGGGIQTALLLQKYGHSVQILEKQQSAGSFWTKYPRFQELISVNKRVSNETQIMRYDWHSMLETPISMWDISQDYFPSGLDFHNYMNRVVKEANIDIQYGFEVASFDTKQPCVNLVNDTTICAKYRVFVATGLQEKDERYLEAIGGVRYSEVTKDMAVGKRVCILGNGNAGMEVAQNIYQLADRVFVMGKHPVRVSAVTKYTGDVRVKFLQTLENFHGKLLDAIYQPSYHLTGIGNNLNTTQLDELHKGVSGALTAALNDCQLLVLATGFLSHVPGLNLDGERFPLMKDWYEMDTNPHVNYVGWLMHKFDFRKGAGGFLSGYRYLIRNLVHHVNEKDHGFSYPYVSLTTEEQLLDYVVKRFQISDELVILQDGVILRDAIVTVINEEGANEYHYYEGVTYQFHPEFDDNTIYLYLRWGDGRSAASVFDNIYTYSDTKKLRNTKLHPVIEVDEMTREAQEDIDMSWTDEMFTIPIRSIVSDAIRGDYSLFRPKETYSYERGKYNQPKENYVGPEVGESLDSQPINVRSLRKALTKAIQLDGTKEALEMVREEARIALTSMTFHESNVSSPPPEGNSEMPTSCAPGGTSCGISECCEGMTCLYIPRVEDSFCVYMSKT